MSYGRVLKPRFFVDNVNWMLSTGQMDYTDITKTGTISTGTVYEHFDMNPFNRVVWTTNGSGTDIAITVDFGVAVKITHVCILNHNLFSSGAAVSLSWSGGAIAGATEVLNAAITVGSPGYGTPSADGDTILDFGVDLVAKTSYDLDIITGSTFTDNIEIGAILFGVDYTMSHRPEMGTPKGVEYPVKGTETASGKRFSNVQWVGAPINGYAPFKGAVNLGYGRFNQDFSYKYLDDTDVIGVASYGSIPTSLWGINSRVLGGHLPMVYGVDSTSTDVDDYYFCRLRNMGRATEPAYNVMDIGYSIEEEF